VERDIHAFISEELKDLSEFQDKHLADLAAKSDGLFEWARLACGYIKGDYTGLSPMDLFDAVVNRHPGERRNLLYDMYRLILTEITPKDKYTKVLDFFVERTKAQDCDLALASLRVMEHSLRFNICDLKSSYLPNSQDTGLPERVKTSIPAHLSYSCRHWATHVQTTDFEDELAKEIRSLFDNERLMFWVEALGLLNAIRGAVTVLPLVAKWLKVSTYL
jgi:hypothetical protein